jgi:hypothetical protein
MKMTHALIITAFMGILTFSSFAGEYKKPSIKWKSSDVTSNIEVAKEKDFKEFKENSYKVEEDPSSQRNLASEEEEGRGPSSEAPSKVELQRWQYQK